MNNTVIFSGLITLSVILISCSSQENKTYLENIGTQTTKNKEIIQTNVNYSGAESREIFVGSDKRGRYNPFQIGPIEPNINEWILSGPYDGLRTKGEESNPMYGDPYSYWKDNRDSHSSIKSGALITFVFTSKNTSVELGGSGIVEVIQHMNGTTSTIKKIIVEGKRKYYSIDNAQIGTTQNNLNRHYIYLRFSKGVDIYGFKLQ